MLFIKRYRLLLTLLSFIFVLYCVSQYIQHARHRTRIQRDEIKSTYLQHLSTYITDAQKDGNLGMYEPYVSSDEPIAPQLYGMYVLVQGKKGIKRYACESGTRDFHDEKIMFFIASLPDLEEIEIKYSKLIGNSFEPFENHSAFRRLSLRSCCIKIDVYRSLTKVNGLKELTILSQSTTDTSDDDIRQTGLCSERKINATEAAEIVNIISQCKQLKNLVLEEEFLNWQDEIQKNLPDTTVQFGILP